MATIIYATDSGPEKIVNIIDTHERITTCQCGNTHYWVVDEASWECESCWQYVYERYYIDFSVMGAGKKK